jgi:selenium metabolism protein YedF
MEKIVDARGLPCPKPVILTRKAMQQSARLTAIVDNEIAQHNVTRMAQKAGRAVQAEAREDGIYLHIGENGSPQPAEAPPAIVVPSGGSLVVVAPSEFMGRGEEELGHVLMRAFFHTLGEVEPLPNTIIFYNSGVKLAAQGSPIVEDLLDLAARGVEILACGTCLGYYELMDKLAVGEVSNMYTIAETMLGASKVVSL